MDIESNQVPDMESDSLANLNEIADDGVDALKTLQTYDQFVQGVPGETLAAESYQLVRMAIADIQRRLGGETIGLKTIATESFSPDAVSKATALESISDTANAIWAKLVAIIKAIKDAVVKFFKGVKEALLGVEQKAAKVEKTPIRPENAGKEIKDVQDTTLYVFLGKSKNHVTPEDVLARMQEYERLNELFFQYVVSIVETYDPDIETKEQLNQATRSIQPKLQHLVSSFEKVVDKDNTKAYEHKNHLATLQLNEISVSGVKAHASSRFKFENPTPDGTEPRFGVQLCTDDQKGAICRESVKLMGWNTKLTKIADEFHKVASALGQKPNDDADLMVRMEVATTFRMLVLDIRAACTINNHVAFKALRFAEMGTREVSGAA